MAPNWVWGRVRLRCPRASGVDALIWFFESVFASALVGKGPQTHLEQLPDPASPALHTTQTQSLIAFFKELPVVLAKLRPVLVESSPQQQQQLQHQPEGGGGGSIEDALRLREWQET